MKNMSFMCLALVVLALVPGAGEATEVTLNQVTFPERNEIEIGFARDQRAPEATMIAEVRVPGGTGRYEHPLPRDETGDPLRRRRHLLRPVGGDPRRHGGEHG